jgi:hypothetical protein
MDRLTGRARRPVEVVRQAVGSQDGPHVAAAARFVQGFTATYALEVGGGQRWTSHRFTSGQDDDGFRFELREQERREGTVAAGAGHGVPQTDQI